MAEGYDDYGYTGFNIDGVEDYHYDQLNHHFNEISLEKDSLYKRYGDNENTPEYVRVMYGKFNIELRVIEGEKDRRYNKTETTFVDDGKSVTIKGISTVKVPGVEFVQEKEGEKFADIDEKVYNILDETFNDEESNLSDISYTNLMKRVEQIGAENKANMDNQFERVISITKLVQKKNKVNLNPRNPIAKQILDRSNVIQLKDGSDTLYFRPRLRNGQISTRSLQIMKTGKTSVPQYSSAIKSEAAVEQYKELIKQYKEGVKSTIYDEEHQVADVVTQSDNYKDKKGLTAEENRETEGVLNPSATMVPGSRVGDFGALQIQADNFQETINRTVEQRDNTDNSDERIELDERISGLKQARDQTLKQRQLEEVRETQEEDITRLQRFKEWVKENKIGLSGVAISIAGILTTVIISARTVITKGAQATGKFAKAVYKTFRDIAKGLGPILGPVVSAIGSLLSVLLKYGAEGIAWLAQNLWALVIALAYLIYSRYKKK